MFNSLSRQRVSLILLLTGIALAVYYLVVYRSLSKTVDALDRPLTNVWSQLITTNAETRVVEGIDFRHSNDALRKVQAARRALVQQREQILSRIALAPDLQSKLRQPFQLLDFQNERQLQVEDISKLAKQQGVTLDPSVTGAYPRYTAIEEQPAELWAELAILHQTLSAAIHSKVSVIRNAALLPGQSHPPLGPHQPGLLEVRVSLNLTAPMSSVSRFLFALPLTGDEITAASLPTALTNKPALFIEKWMLRKASAEKPNDVQLDIVISGFAAPGYQPTAAPHQPQAGPNL